MVSSEIVKQVMLDKIRENLNAKAVEIQQDLKLNYGLDVSYHKAWYGKELAREEVLGVEADLYRQLKWFGELSCEANPGSRIAIDCAGISEADNGNLKFKRMFVSYGALLNGFQHSRPVLHVDATFITNKYRGMLLGATAKDYNCGIYPVAYAIVDSETEDNWMYFLKLLHECLAAFPERKMTFISDRNLGLLKAVHTVFPGSHLGFCYRHLQSNLMNKFPKSSYIGKRISTLFMRCSYSRTTEYFELNLKSLRLNGGVVVDNILKDLPYDTWVSCYFNGERFGEMMNNLIECFNSWIKDIKGLPIFELNDAIRVKIMSLIANRNHEASLLEGELCPNLEKPLLANMEMGRHWVVYKSDTHLYEVQCQKFTMTMDLDSFSCSCGEWQVQGFSCAHAIVVVLKDVSDILSYVNPIFKVANYRRNYSFTIKYVPTISKLVEMVRNYVNMDPPLTKRLVGRPKVNRFKSKNEVKSLMKCGRCKKFAGHNRKTCKEII